MRKVTWSLKIDVKCILLFSFPVYFPDRAVVDFNLTSQQAAILITILGASHILARPLSGFIGSKDQSVFMKQTVYALSPLIAGLGSCLSIWCDDMAKQIVFVIIFGITSGKFMIKRPNSNVHIESSFIN